MTNFFDQFHKKGEDSISKNVEPRTTFIMDETGAMRAVKKGDLKGDKGDAGADGKDGIDGKDGAKGRGIEKTLMQGDTLFLRYDDGKTEKVAKIVGRDGKDGINGKDGVDGKDGASGKDGVDGRGIIGAEINKVGELVLSFSDGIIENYGKVRGEDGRQVIHGGGTNIGVGVMDAGSLIGTGISLIDFTGAGINSINRVDRKVTIDISGGGGGDALTSNPLSQFAATTSAQLRGVMSDEVGTGALVFASTKAEFDSACTDGNFLYTGDITPAGSSSEIQFNNSGAFGADTNFAWDNTNKRLRIGATYAAAQSAPLEVQVNGAGTGFVMSYSTTEYTRFISGGLLKGLLGTGSIPFVVGNGGNIELRPSDTSVITASTSTQNILINSSAAAVIPLVVRGAASQTGNLTQWQDSSSVVRASISSAGGITGTVGTASFILSSSGVSYLQATDSATGLRLHSAWGLKWGTSSAGDAADTAIIRNAAGIVEINNGTAGTYRDLRARAAYWSRTATSTSASSAGETIIGVTDTSAPRIITLATADVDSGRIIYIKDESGGAGTNNITIDTQGAELIDGAASIVITANYGVAKLYCNGTNWFTL